MTKKEITVLALRIIALYILIHAMLMILNMFNKLILTLTHHSIGPETPVWGLWVGGIVLALAALSIAVIVWIVAGRAVADTDNQSKSPFFENIEPLILSVVGLFFIMQALIQLGQVTSQLFFLMDTANQNLLAWQMRGAGYLFQLFIGLSLVFRPLWWTNFLVRFREKRHDETMEDA